MPRKLALKTSEKPGFSAPSKEQAPGSLPGSRKRSKPVSQPALQSGAVAIAKIGFDRSRGTKVTEVSAKNKAPTSRRHKGDKGVESQPQRESAACVAASAEASAPDGCEAAVAAPPAAGSIEGIVIGPPVIQQASGGICERGAQFH